MPKNTVMPDLIRHPRDINSLELSIFDTVRFFDITDMPVTATHIWQHLITANSHDKHHPSLRDVQITLASSSFLRERIETQWGYFVLKGRLSLVRQYLVRHAISQDKWKILKRCAPFLAAIPFVKGLAGSGSLAQGNTKHSSDLDIFVVVKEGRIWTARLLMLCVTQLLGRRRTYAERSAPDMLCVNHYITDSSLLVSSDIQNVYMAVQYASLVPLYEESIFRAFLRRNSAWMDQYIQLPVRPFVSHRYTIFLQKLVEGIKRQVELLLLEPLGDYVERFAEQLQRFIIARHGGFSKVGRIKLSYHELAFHPDTKVPGIVRAFRES